MTKRLLVLALAGIMVTGAQAQRNKNVDKQLVIYKWKAKGGPSYAQIPPYGINDYIMLNKQGMRIEKERPFNDGKSSNIIRAIRPGDSEQANANAPAGAQKTAATGSQAQQAPRPGTISVEQRCESLRKDLNSLQNNKTVYEQDASGNLIPMTADEVAARTQSVQSQISQFCTN